MSEACKGRSVSNTHIINNNRKAPSHLTTRMTVMSTKSTRNWKCNLYVPYLITHYIDLRLAFQVNFDKITKHYPQSKIFIMQLEALEPWTLKANQPHSEISLRYEITSDFFSTFAQKLRITP